MAQHNQNWPVHTLAAVLKKLPPCAAAKMRAVNSTIIDSTALINSTDAQVQELEPVFIDLQRRLSRLDPRTDADDIHRTEGEIAVIEHDREKLASERAKRSGIRDNAQQVRAQLEAWLGAWETGGVHIGGALRPAVIKPARRKGENIRDALLRVRSKIAEVKSEIVRTKQAPLPPAEVKREIERQVQQLADKGRPILNLDGGKVDLRFSIRRCSANLAPP